MRRGRRRTTLFLPVTRSHSREASQGLKKTLVASPRNMSIRLEMEPYPIFHDHIM